MGVHFEWDNDKQVVIVHVEAPWTWEEYRTVVDEVYAQIVALNKPVAIIADIVHMGQLPAGNLLRQLQYAQKQTPKNVNTTVLVGAPYVVTTFLNVVTKVHPNPSALVLFAASVDEALALLQQHDSSSGKAV